jgi:hypothetical protein
MLRVQYSDGFVAEVPVAPDGNRLFIFDYDPLNLLSFSWQVTHRTFVLPLQPLTREEAKWMHDATKHPLPTWLRGHGRLPQATSARRTNFPSKLRRR